MCNYIEVFNDQCVYIAAVSVTIVNSAIPSNDLTVAIALRGATAGAVISPVNNSVSIILMAHDHVAGLISFNTTQYSVTEGQLISLFKMSILKILTVS